MLKLRIFSVVLTTALLAGLMFAFPVSADKVDSYVFDFENYSLGHVLNRATGDKAAETTVQQDPDNPDNQVARIEYTAGKYVNPWGPEFTLPENVEVSGSKLVYEVRIRFDGNDNTAKLTLHLTSKADNKSDWIWAAYSPNYYDANTLNRVGCIELYRYDGASNTNTYWNGQIKKTDLGDGEFEYEKIQDGVLEEGTWYRIVTEINTTNNQYIVKVCDDDYNVLRTTEELNSPHNVRVLHTFEDLSQGFKTARLRYNGSYFEGEENYVYVDDIKFYTIPSPYDDALAAVVKAEKTKAKEDVLAAINLVNALEDGADKQALLARLDAIDAVWVDTPVFYLGSIAPENIVETLSQGSIIATAEVSSNNETPRQATLVAALYKKVDETRSVLVKCSFSQPQTVAGMTPVGLEASLDVENIDDGDYFVKAFVWNNGTELMPLLSMPGILPE